MNRPGKIHNARLNNKVGILDIITKMFNARLFRFLEYFVHRLFGINGMLIFVCTI